MLPSEGLSGGPAVLAQAQICDAGTDGNELGHVHAHNGISLRTHLNHE